MSDACQNQDIKPCTTDTSPGASPLHDEIASTQPLPKGSSVDKNPAIEWSVKDIQHSSPSKPDKIDGTTSGTTQALTLLGQATMTLASGKTQTTPEYEQLLRSAVAKADSQLKADECPLQKQIHKDQAALQSLSKKPNTDSKSRDELQTQLTALNDKLALEKHTSFVAHIYLASELREQGHAEEANQLLHQAMFDLGGTPQDITGAAESVQAKLGMQFARPLYLMAIDAADYGYNAAMTQLHTSSSDAIVDLSKADREHLAELLMAPAQAQFAYGKAVYNLDSSSTKDKAVGTSWIKSAQDKLPSSDPIILASARGGYSPLAHYLAEPLERWKNLISDTFNFTEVGDGKITPESVSASADQLPWYKQMVCDSLAFTAGIGAAVLVTPDTLGIATVPAFLITRAAAGSLAYNLARSFLYGRPISKVSLAQGALDGVVGGMDEYYFKKYGVAGLRAAWNSSYKGALVYGSGNVLLNYSQGAYRSTNLTDFSSVLSGPGLDFGLSFGIGVVPQLAIGGGTQIAPRIASFWLRRLSVSTAQPNTYSQPE